MHRYCEWFTVHARWRTQGERRRAVFSLMHSTAGLVNRYDAQVSPEGLMDRCCEWCEWFLCVHAEDTGGTGAGNPISNAQPRTCRASKHQGLWI